MPPVNGLTERQERFVHHYVELGNATEAARRAGYSDANQSGWENKAKQDVMEAINEKKRKIYDENRLRERLTDVIEFPDNQTVLINAIRVGMLEKAMLTERNINENLNKNVSEESADPTRAALEAIRLLRESEQSAAKLSQVIDNKQDAAV